MIILVFPSFVLSSDLCPPFSSCCSSSLPRPQILPISELSKVLFSVLLRTVTSTFKKIAKSQGLTSLSARIPEIRIYTPDFKRAVDHFGIHAGTFLSKPSRSARYRTPFFSTDSRTPPPPSLHHIGGRGVLDGIEKNLRLQAHHLEASRMTLYNYGNTSSSSIWYEMEYIQEHMNLRSGQRVLQVAFGSGFKCNSAVWVSLHV